MHLKVGSFDLRGGYGAKGVTVTAAAAPIALKAVTLATVTPEAAATSLAKEIENERGE